MGQQESMTSHGGQLAWGPRSSAAGLGREGYSNLATSSAITSGQRPHASGQLAGHAMRHWAEAAGPTRGPFSPYINSVLSASFGQSLEGITVARGEGDKNHGIGAEAHTIGTKVSLGSNVSEDAEDARSLEIIGHEVAHALAGGGAGKTLLDQPGDPGETAAYDAGRQLRNFAVGGGSIPQLRPAYGGQAAIHRYEGGEHKDAMDNAAKTLKAEGVAVDPKVAAQMSKKIKLGNGLEVAPGDVTAMMGDFYGAFDKGKDGKDHFNPGKSFEAMNSADPEEMKKILAKIHREYDDVQKAKDGKGEFKATATSEFDEITENRKVTTDKDGTTSGYQFLELAKRNANHFNKEDSSGFDNNMGSYGEMHRLALKAASDGDENRARAMEAAAQHFLTDRFSAGHQFDKDKIIEAGSGGLLGQGMSRFVHNFLNQNGVSMSDESGHTWTGRGDEHWADKENKDNRLHTARSTYESYADLQAVLSGQKKPEDAQKDSKVGGLVPQWNPKTEKFAELLASPVIAPNVPGFWDKFAIPEGLDMGKEKGHDLKKWAGQKWDGATNWVGDKWQGAKDWAGRQWQGTKQTASEVKEWGSQKLHNAGEWADQQWQTTKQDAGAVKEWGSQKLHNAGEWADQQWQSSKQDAGAVKEWGSQKLHNAGEWADQQWQTTKRDAGAAKDWAGQKWQGAKDTASEASDKASSAWGWLKKAVSRD